MLSQPTAVTRLIETAIRSIYLGRTTSDQARASTRPGTW